MFEKFLNDFKVTGNLNEDVQNFLVLNNLPKTAEHSFWVSCEAEILARKFEMDPILAKQAGLLHDISAVFPNSQRVSAAYQLGIDVLDEEVQFPLIIHQKISRVMAKEIFNIDNVHVLNAIECHTTLKANPSRLDLILFVADKIQWDQPGTPPYIQELKQQLNVSLEHAAFSYIKYLWDRKENLKVLHPWLNDAYLDLSKHLKIT
ncbi:bis(5'-nucleosyl)-tetraphosphatase (symmetrical) YqeK [Bacillus mycoides]